MPVTEDQRAAQPRGHHPAGAPDVERFGRRAEDGGDQRGVAGHRPSGRPAEPRPRFGHGAVPRVVGDQRGVRHRDDQLGHQTAVGGRVLDRVGGQLDQVDEGRGPALGRVSPVGAFVSDRPRCRAGLEECLEQGGGDRVELGAEDTASGVVLQQAGLVAGRVVAVVGKQPVGIDDRQQVAAEPSHLERGAVGTVLEQAGFGLGMQGGPLGGIAAVRQIGDGDEHGVAVGPGDLTLRQSPAGGGQGRQPWLVRRCQQRTTRFGRDVARRIERAGGPDVGSGRAVVDVQSLAQPHAGRRRTDPRRPPAGLQVADEGKSTCFELGECHGLSAKQAHDVVVTQLPQRCLRHQLGTLEDRRPPARSGRCCGW